MADDGIVTFFFFFFILQVQLQHTNYLKTEARTLRVHVLLMPLLLCQVHNDDEQFMNNTVMSPARINANTLNFSNREHLQQSRFNKAQSQHKYYWLDLAIDRYNLINTNNPPIMELEASIQMFDCIKTNLVLFHFSDFHLNVLLQLSVASKCP